MNQIWTLDSIKEGFERFRMENGRLPTAPEIDGLDYLPSSRQIQRRYGGLEELRRVLGYEDVHFGRGVFRGAISSRVGIRGRDAEITLEKNLIEKFGEVFVHTEKMFGNSKNRVDFYVYSPDGNFGVDIFYTDTFHNFQKNINIKAGKYGDFKQELFFVVGNSNFSQTEADQCVASRVSTLPSNIKVVTLETFLHILRKKRSYPNPIH